MQMLDRPVTADQLASQPIEQLWMRRGLGTEAKVAEGRNNATSKMVMPEAVDDDAWRERIVFVNDRPGKLDAPLLLHRMAVQSERAQYFNRIRRDDFALG